MKILYISSLLFKKSSSASIRNTGLIQGINGNNIDVDILTIKYPDIVEDDYLKEKIGNSTVYSSELKVLNSYLNSKKEIENKLNNNKLKKYKNKILSIIKSVVKDVYFFPDVDKEWISEFQKMEIDYSKYDLIISSSDTKTSHYVGEIIKRNNPSIPWFQIWGDPWESDIGLKGIKKIRAKSKEYKLLTQADKVFYVSPFTVKEMKLKYQNLESKLTYLPRGYLEEIVGNSEEKDEIIITYTGVLNKNRDISKLLLKIKEYNTSNIKKVVFNLYGTIDKLYLKELDMFECFNYKGSVAFSEIKEVYKNTDYLLFMDNGTNTTQIPGKISDYLGTNKKIICIFQKENEIAKYFENNLGLLVFTNENLNIEKIIDSGARKIDRRFSNDEISKRVIKFYKEMNE